MFFSLGKEHEVLLFYSIVMYAIEFETNEKQKLPEIKN